MYMTGASSPDQRLERPMTRRTVRTPELFLLRMGFPKTSGRLGTAGSLKRDTSRFMAKNPCCTQAAGSVATIFISEPNSPSAQRRR